MSVMTGQQSESLQKIDFFAGVFQGFYRLLRHTTHWLLSYLVGLWNYLIV